MRNLSLIFAAILSIPAARAEIDISKSAGGRAVIDVNPLRAGTTQMDRTFYTVLRNDLVRSGYFALARNNLAEYRVTGTINGGAAAVTAVDVGRGAVRYRKNHSFNTETASARAHQVADELLFALRGKRGFASARLAMIGTRTGHKELYLCNSDGGRLMRLTTDRKISLAPDWGPNGTLYYTSYLKGWPDIYRIDTRTFSRSRVAGFPGLNTDAAVSPRSNEMALVLSKGGRPEVYVMAIGSERPRAITSSRRLCAKSSPSWSPDGNRICYVSDESGRPHLYVVSRSGGKPRRITTQGRENVSPAWGPDGIIYSSRVGGRYRIAITDPAGRRPARLLTPDGIDFEDPSWAPDGRHIACTRSVNYRSSVYLLDTKEPSRLEPLVEGNGDWYSPAWTP